jgi:hypothetical protein
MIDRIFHWLGWGRPPDQPAPNKRSSALLRLQNICARNTVDQNRRPHRGGTGTEADQAKKDKPAVRPDDYPPS